MLEPPCQGTPSTHWMPHTHLELKVRVFQELLIHGFCKLVDCSQEDPGRGEKITRPSQHARSGIPPHLPDRSSLKEGLKDPKKRSADPPAHTVDLGPCLLCKNLRTNRLTSLENVYYLLFKLLQAYDRKFMLSRKTEIASSTTNKPTNELPNFII